MGVQVPRSSKLVAEDSDLALFSVTLFKRVADGFKAAARQKGFQVWPAATSLISWRVVWKRGCRKMFCDGAGLQCHADAQSLPSWCSPQ